MQFLTGIHVGKMVGAKAGSDYPERIRQLRGRLGLTQQSLADCLGVSFVTVNRWENGKVKPSQLSWNQLRLLEPELIAPGAVTFLVHALVVPSSDPADLKQLIDAASIYSAINGD